MSPLIHILKGRVGESCQLGAGILKTGLTGQVMLGEKEERLFMSCTSLVWIELNSHGKEV